MGNRAPIVYSSSGAVMFIDMAAAPGARFGEPAKKMQSTIKEDLLMYMPWALWGTNNLLPQEMIRDIETCGVLNAIIDGKARFAICEGIQPVIMKVDGANKVVDRIVDKPEIVDFLEMNNHYFQSYGWMKDLLGFGNAVTRFMLNKAYDKIYSFKRDDVTEMRYEKEDKTTGKINRLYHSANWELIVNEKDNRILKIPLLDRCNPLMDLQEKAKSSIAEHNMTFSYPGWGKHYYPVPLWYAAYKWVKIAQGVPEMKAAMFENNMRLKYQVTIFEQYWSNAFEDWEDIEDDEREARRNTLFDEIDSFLVGSKNAYKSIYVDGKYTLDGKEMAFIKIEPIEDTTKQGELLPDSAAANSEIAIAMLWNNAMTGGNQKAGLYQGNEGGSNVREASAMQVIIHELERKNVQRVMNVIKYFNGWHETYPGLEFIIPGTILTTLDTGSSTKQITTGGASKEKDNGTDKNNS